MMDDLQQLIKDNTGKCECGKEFVAWELNWDGAYELKKCRDCTKKAKEAAEELYKSAIKKGKPVITLTGEVEGWKYKGKFYDNPEYHLEVGKIDDKIRAAKKQGIKIMKWDIVEYEVLRYFMKMCGFYTLKKNFTYRGIKHRLK